MKNMLEITISLSKETTSSKPQKNTTTNSLEVWATHSPSPLICTLNFSRQCVFIWSAIRLCAGKALVESSEGPKRGSQLISGEQERQLKGFRDSGQVSQAHLATTPPGWQQEQIIWKKRNKNPIAINPSERPHILISSSESQHSPDIYCFHKSCRFPVLTWARGNRKRKPWKKIAFTSSPSILIEIWLITLSSNSKAAFWSSSNPSKT